jgi:hypothetical protein
MDAILTTPLYNAESLTGIDDVEVALSRLDADIPNASLDPLVNFNHTYLIITRNVKLRLQEQLFDYPKFLNRFDTTFASYYIDAFRNHLQGGDVPAAWRQAFEAAEQGAASPFKCMALGVNAHINNDIPQVLLQTKANNKHTRDYLFVNSIIWASLDEVINDLDVDQRLLSPKTRILKPLYKLSMRWLVVVLRWLAWRNFTLLKAGKIKRQNIEIRAKRIARIINALPI